MTALAPVGRVELPAPVGGSLDVWWLEQYGGGLFLPLRDGTAGSGSYGGGRYLLDTAKAEKLRLTVFTGPVFTARDPKFQGTRIPLSFWKVPVFQRPDGSHSASAYMISQHELVEGILREAFTPVTFQVPIRRISELTGLDFGHLFGWDPMNDEFEPLPRAQEALATPTPARELRTLEDVQL